MEDLILMLYVSDLLHATEVLGIISAALGGLAMFVYFFGCLDDIWSVSKKPTLCITLLILLGLFIVAITPSKTVRNAYIATKVGKSLLETETGKELSKLPPKVIKALDAILEEYTKDKGE